MTAALTAAKRALMARLATEVGTTAQVSIVRPLKADLVTQESGTMVWACLVPESDTSGEIAVFGGGAPFRWDEDTTFRVLIQAACLVPVEAENALAAADASLAEADDLADAVLAADPQVIAHASPEALRHGATLVHRLRVRQLQHAGDKITGAVGEVYSANRDGSGFRPVTRSSAIAASTLSVIVLRKAGCC